MSKLKPLAGRRKRRRSTLPDASANAFYDRLIVLRETCPALFALISPASKVSLGYYEQAKAHMLEAPIVVI